MRQKNPIFIFVLVASVFLYIIGRGVLGGLAVSVFLASVFLASMGLMLSSRQGAYYLMLSIFSLVLIGAYALGYGMPALFFGFYMPAVLIALLVAIVEYRVMSNAAPKRRIARIRAEADKSRAQTLSEERKAFESDIADAGQLVKSYKERLSEAKDEAVKLKESLEKKEESIKIAKEINQKLKENAEEAKRALSERARLEKRLKEKESEIEKQAELKRKYSKTIRNIRKAKKEEEELLVVSSDGKSVHKPHCIVVRNIPKDKRVLIKDWKTAEKEHYVGCKVCNPHKKDKILVNGHGKFRFVASKDSDKVHRAYCIVAKDIETKDRVYFKTFRMALKKGYTSCRVCNPN